MKIGEIEKISSSLPYFSDLLISGGEPFLREDLAEIISLFRKNNRIKTVSIPTNGLLEERTIKITKDILELNPEIEVSINVSIDWPEKIHDYIRGVEGGFQKTINTLKSLAELKRKKRKLSLGIVTVVNSYNLGHLQELMDFINSLEEESVLHNFEIIRGAPKETVFSEKIEAGRYKEAYSRILDYQTKRNISFYKNKPFSLIKTSLAKTHLELFYNIQKDYYLNNRKWPMRCVAGRNIFVMDYNGDIRACELREKIINAREKNYDISGWKGFLKKERGKIIEGKCSCTHACFLYQSIHYSPQVLLFSFLPLFLKNILKIK